MFYNFDGIIFVSSYDNKKSLEYINTWYQLLIEYVDLSTKEMIWIINKKDLNGKKILTEEEFEKKSKELLDYFEVSSKTGENIEHYIKSLIKKLIKKYNDELLDKNSQDCNYDSDIENNEDSCCIF